MPYTFNTAEDRQAMLDAIGVGSVDELFGGVPDSLRLAGPLQLPPAMSELELSQQMERLAKQNLHTGNSVCFLGGGSYDHFVPAAVDAIASRGEFYTSYTPYQPEVSQGNLQVMFEYQTLICQLTGMDVSNASLYDGGSAAAEAVLLAIAATRRTGKVVMAGSVHPEYRQIVETYLRQLDVETETMPAGQGVLSRDQVADAIDDQTACLLIQSPNFFGCLEEVAAFAEMAHERGALLVLACDPISLGLLHRPGELGVDVVVAEGQSLGTPMQYGGPYLGIMACREAFVRKMPGRIAGQTVDRLGRRCWALTMQTREQHIRREKATSNICTNQGLFALRAAIHLALLGPHGLRETAHLCLQKAAYAAERLTKSDRFELAWQHPTFKEFVVRDRRNAVRELLAEAVASGYLAGIPLGTWFPELADCFLVAVTEQRTQNEIDGWAACLQQAEVESAVEV